jgi:hypothetical protein
MYRMASEGPVISVFDHPAQREPALSTATKMKQSSLYPMMHLIKLDGPVAFDPSIKPLVVHIIEVWASCCALS